jgi:hypothetical protein
MLHEHLVKAYDVESPAGQVPMVASNMGNIRSGVDDGESSIRRGPGIVAAPLPDWMIIGRRR